MKRYVCTVAAGLLLALAGSGTASATGLPVLGGIQEATQSVSFGDQTVGEQRNDADVTQKQGNGNVNIAPAVAIFGDAETTNKQGNGNTADASVTQSNDVTQSQSAIQKQDLTQLGPACCRPMEKTRYDEPDQGSKDECCDGQSQTGTQHVYGGDQTVDKQKNEADVSQYQGNGNVNIAPAVAVFGDAKTENYQGNGNTADASVTQSNDVTQSQSAKQKQHLFQDGSDCCEPKSDDKPKHDGDREEDCCDGSSQTGEQTTSFGDQTVGKQQNDAEVTQKQGNGNVNVSPAIGLGGKKHDKCGSKCDRKGHGGHGAGDASTRNAQGNGNTAAADVDQSNAVEQSQRAFQYQRLVDACKEVISR